jgi:hypothetical protein
MTEIKKEEINEEDLTPEEEIKIARLTLGTGYNAEITIKEKYIFKVSCPTFMQDLQIGINANNMLVDMIKEDGDMKWIANVICTIRMVVTEIEEMTNENGIERKVPVGKGPDCFWRFIENRHDVDDVYKIIILPLYMEYLRFKETIKTNVEELKNF